MEKRKLNRRDFLRLTAAAATGALAAACAPAAPQIIEVEKEVPVEKVVVQTVEVEKVVKETVVVEKPAKPIEKIEILYVERGGPYEGVWFERIADAFNEKQDSIYVNWQPVATGIREKIRTMYAAGSPPDVHYVDERALPNWAAGGLLLSLSPIIEKDTAFDLDDYYPEPLLNGMYKGDLYGLNWSICPNLYYCNWDMYDEAGVDHPEVGYTWDDGREAAGKMTKKGETLGWGPVHKNQIWEHIWQAGWELFDDELTKSNLDEPEVIDAMQWWADLTLKDGYAPTPQFVGDRSKGELFQTGRIANYSDCVFQLQYAKDWEFGWGVAWGPRHPSKEFSTCLNYCSFNSISSRTKYPDACWEWVKYWTSPEWQFKVNQAMRYIATRKSVNEMKPYVDANMPNVDWDLWIVAAEQGHRPPVSPHWAEVDDLQNSAFDEILRGKKTAKEAFTEVAPRITELLQKGYGI